MFSVASDRLRKLQAAIITERIWSTPRNDDPVKSDAPNIGYGQELFAQSVYAVLPRAGNEKAVFTAHRMGGPASTMFLRLFPYLVAGIIYVDSLFHSPETYLSVIERQALAKTLQEDSKLEALINSFWTEKSTLESRTKVLQTVMGTNERVKINIVTTDARPLAFDERKFSTSLLS